MVKNIRKMAFFAHDGKSKIITHIPDSSEVISGFEGSWVAKEWWQSYWFVLAAFPKVFLFIETFWTWTKNSFFQLVTMWSSGTMVPMCSSIHLYYEGENLQRILAWIASTPNFSTHYSSAAPSNYKVELGHSRKFSFPFRHECQRVEGYAIRVSGHPSQFRQSSSFIRVYAARSLFGNDYTYWHEIWWEC